MKVRRFEDIPVGAKFLKATPSSGFEIIFLKIGIPPHYEERLRMEEGWPNAVILEPLGDRAKMHFATGQLCRGTIDRLAQDEEVIRVD